EDLGLANDHGIETRGYAEEVTNGFAVLEPVEMRIDSGNVLMAVQSQKTADDAQGIFMIRDGGRDLHPVAGRKYDGFRRPALLRLAKGVWKGLFGDGEPLPE